MVNSPLLPNLSIRLLARAPFPQVHDNFKVQAYALILLRTLGYPCVFVSYSNATGKSTCTKMTHLFFALSLFYRCVFYGDYYPNRECYNEDVARGIRLLVEARRKYAYGPSVDYFADRNCIGFVRKGDRAHFGCAVVLSNKE
jgi:alpha-amylase